MRYFGNEKAQQGARANAGTCHGSCWRTLRAKPRRGSSLTLGEVMRIQPPYDENYGTCAYVHAWLRVMHETVDPDEVTQIMGVTPTKVQRRGDPKRRKPGFYAKGGWFLSSEGVIKSKDARHHLDWIIAKIADKQAPFAQLHARGYLIDLCVRWDSLSGHGGPTLSPSQMKALADLEIELWFDVYVGELKT